MYREREIFENFTTCLAMILSYHGGANLQDLLREVSQLDCSAGASFATLATLAHGCGFSALGMELDDEWLYDPEPGSLPCIAYYSDPVDRYTGAVVIEHVSPEAVTLVSSRSGRKRIGSQEFLANWRERILTIEPTERAFDTTTYRAWMARAQARQSESVRTPAKTLSAAGFRALAYRLADTHRHDGNVAMDLHHLIIVGAGPAGIATALQARALGLRYLVLEKGAVVESLRHFPPSMHFVSPTGDVGMAGFPFAADGPQPTSEEAVAHYELVARDGDLRVHTGEEVLAIEREEDWYRVTTARDCYYAVNVVLATGYYENPKPLSVPGIDLPKVYRSYSQAFLPSLDVYCKHVAVLGGGVSAVSVALHLHARGALVKLIHRGAQLKHSIIEEGDVLFPEFASVAASGGFDVLDRTELLQVKRDTLEVRGGEIGDLEFANELLFVMIGYTPHVELLRDLDVEMHTECAIPRFDFDTFETSAPGLFVVGTAKGFGLFRHFRHQARCICRTIAARCGVALPE